MNMLEGGKLETLDILDGVIADLQGTVECQAVMFARKLLASYRPFHFAIAMVEVGYKMKEPERLGNPQEMAEERKEFKRPNDDILSALDIVVSNLQMGSDEWQAVVIARECVEMEYWNGPEFEKERGKQREEAQRRLEKFQKEKQCSGE